MIFEKAGTGACGSNRAYWQSWEYMFVFSKGKVRCFNPVTIKGSKISSGGIRNKIEKQGKKELRQPSEREQRKSNVWRYAVGGANRDDKTGHPAVFPEMLASDHIRSWSSQGDVVFDPFLGSGTTGKAAILNGRDFIGIERDPEYFEIASKRINDAFRMKEAATI